MKYCLFIERPDRARRPYIYIENSLFIDEVPLNPDFSYTFTTISNYPRKSVVEGLSYEFSEALLTENPLKAVVAVDSSRQGYYADIVLQLLGRCYVAFSQLAHAHGLDMWRFSLALSAFAGDTHLDCVTSKPIKSFCFYEIGSLARFQEIAAVSRHALCSGNFYCQIYLCYENSCKVQFTNSLSLFSLICAVPQSSSKQDALCYSQLLAVLANHRSGVKQLNYATGYVKCVSRALELKDRLLVLVFMTDKLDEPYEALLKNMAAFADLQTNLSAGKSMDLDTRLEAAYRMGDIYAFYLQQVKQQLEAFRATKVRALRTSYVAWIQSVLAAEKERANEFSCLDVETELRSVELSPSAYRTYNRATEMLDKQLDAETDSVTRMRYEVYRRVAQSAAEQQRQQQNLTVAYQRLYIAQLSTQLSREKAVREAQNVIEGNDARECFLDEVSRKSYDDERKAYQEALSSRMAAAKPMKWTLETVFEQYMFKDQVFYMRASDFRFLQRIQYDGLPQLLQLQGENIHMESNAKELACAKYQKVGQFSCLTLRNARLIVRSQDAANFIVEY